MSVMANFRRVLNVAALLLFAVLVVFWASVAINCFSGLWQDGLKGASNAILRHSAPVTFNQVTQPHALSAAAQYFILALLTVLLGFATRREVRAVIDRFRG
jgi:hypothetical protein